MMRKALLWSCLFVFITLASVSRAQDSSCLNQLVPCMEYINSKRTPSSSCCTPLKELIRSDPRCLCSMLGSSSTTTGVNMTQAQRLPARCGERVNAALCTSSPKTKTALSSSGGELPLVKAVMVATLSVIFQAVWRSIA